MCYTILAGLNGNSKHEHRSNRGLESLLFLRREQPGRRGLLPPCGTIDAVAVAPNSNFIASAGADGRLLLWGVL